MEIKVKIGAAELTFEGRDFKEAIKEAAVFTQRGKCGACDSARVGLDHRNVKGKEGTEQAGKTFDYYDVTCLDCTAKASISEYRNGGFFFKNEWKKYDGGGN